MQTSEELRSRISTTESLHSVVGTMKALAAVSIQQLEGVVRSIDEYNRSVELGLQAALRQRPEGIRPVDGAAGDDLGVVVLGSDQGMCGQFNEEIVAHAAEGIEEIAIPGAERSIVAVGARAALQLELSGYAIDDILSTPASPGAIGPMVEQIAVQIERWQSGFGFDRVVLYYNERSSAGRYRPTTHRLLPIDRSWLDRIEDRPWPTKVLPLAKMPWRPLFAELLQQHILVTLYRAVTHSMMSEQTARMVSMQAAEQNIEERLDELNDLFRTTRQTAITAELLDIVSGFETIRSPGDV